MNNHTYRTTQGWSKIFLHNESSLLIHNVKTKFYSLNYGQQLFPVTVNDGQYENSYVVSPYTAFIHYAKEELVKLQNKSLSIALSIFLTCFGLICKKGKINHLVFVNNYLLSTNLYPAWQGENIAKMTQDLMTKYPNHLLAFRSLNQYQHPELIQHFVQNGYHLLASRQVYLFDQEKAPFHHKKNVIADKKLLLKKDYILCHPKDLNEKDYGRIVELYNLLYLDKYSYHNPQFTVKFVQLCHQKKLLDIYGFRNQDGTLDAVIGFFTLGKTTTAPLVGYDTKLPAQLGLYRRLMAYAFQYAKEKNYLLNLSSGASSFKRLRGGKAEMEYSAIYFNHLPFFRRLFWQVLLFFANNLAKPLLEKYKL